MKFARLVRERPALAPNGLTVEVATTIEDLRALEADYDRLLRSCGNTLPFAMHEWHVAWCNQFLEPSNLVNSQLLFHIARDSAGGCVAIAPLILTRRAVGPIRVSSLDLLGADPAITEIRTSLIKPGCEAAAAWAIQRQLAHVRAVDWLNWGTVSDAHASALCSCADIKFQAPQLDYILDLASSWEALRADLKRNVRESIRKEALERFFTLHALRASMPGAASHRNHFATARSRRFLHEACARMAIGAVVRVFQLVIREEVVAMRIGFAIRDSLYLYYSGFDPRWAKYSVMTATLVEIIKYAIQQRMNTINLSPTKDISKTRWGPREISLRRAVQIAPSPLSRLAWAGFQRAKYGRPLPPWIGNFLRLRSRVWD